MSKLQDKPEEVLGCDQNMIDRAIFMRPMIDLFPKNSSDRRFLNNVIHSPET